LPIGSYLIPFRVVEDGVEAARKVHGARRLESLL
jgi:hypothetical protein